jgi:hypothetical protein
MKQYKTKRSAVIQKLIDVTLLLKQKNETTCIVPEIKSVPFFWHKKPPKKEFFGFFDKIKEDKKEEPINIYNLSKQSLLEYRDKLIKKVIEHRNMTFELGEDYNSEAETWIGKKQKEWFPVFNWLKT